MANFQDLTANTAHNKSTASNPGTDLSQYKPSKGFIQVFGERPYKPFPGQSYQDMRGQQVAYQQLIRDWDIIEPTESPEVVAFLLSTYSYGIGQARMFRSAQRPGLWCRFPGIPARPYDIFELEGWGGPNKAIIDAQALYIEHVGSLPTERLYPHGGLRALNNIKRDLEAAELAE